MYFIDFMDFMFSSRIYQEMYVRTVKSGPLPLTLQILDTAGKKRGRLTKPVSAELVICRGRLGSD